MNPPNQNIAPRLSGLCSPKRPNESYRDYYQRADQYYRALRRQALQECYDERESRRLLSPHSDGNDDNDEFENRENELLIEYLERAVYYDEHPGEYYAHEFAYEYPVQRAHRLGIPFVPHEGPIPSLTDEEDMNAEDDEWREVVVWQLGRRRGESSDLDDTEDNEWREVLEWQRGRRRNEGPDLETPQAPTTSGHKRKEAPAEDSDLEPPAKRTRAATRAGTLRAAASGHKRKGAPEKDGDLEPAAKRTRAATRTGTLPAAASGQKRKRSQEGDSDLATHTQTNTKKRRTDTRPQPTITNRGGKRKRESDEQQTSQKQGGPGAKRRRAGKDTQPLQLQSPASPGPSPEAATNAGGRKLGSSSATKEMSPRPNQTSRITRAQRRLLSGKDSQLLQLGQRGELDVQVTASHKDTSKDTAGKPRSARAGTGTSTRSDRRNKKRSAKSEVGNSTLTESGACSRRCRR